MPTQILSTKLYPPQPSVNLIDRHKLATSLDRGLTKSILVVAASPGFGKTTLLAEWLSEQNDRKAAWYSLDEDDNEPGRFFSYIAASLHPLEHDSCPTLDSLLETGSKNPRELSAALLNDLSEFVSKNVVLILDDYQYITSQTIHDAVAYLIDHLPNNIHLVIISRVDPPLPLGRWRVRGQLAEIRADELRFTEEETVQFLNQTMRLSLSTEDIHTLEARTEGWIAGLQLAALSLQKSSNPSELIAAFAGSNRLVADYLTDEVLSRQTDTIRNFLLRTSILERFNAALCDSLLELPKGTSQTTLDELQRANLFIISLDAETNWFRYHHLFAELLRRRLAQTDQDLVATLHHRAAEWFEGNNFLLDAIRHWIAADQMNRVAALLERRIEETWGQADLSGLLSHIEKIPVSVLAFYPALSAFLGWSWLWLGYGTKRTLPLLDRAEHNLKDKTQNYLLGRLNVVRSAVSRVSQNDSYESLRLAQLALNQLAPQDLLWRSFAQLSIALATYSLGKLVDAEQAYSQTIHLCEQAGDQTTAWIAACARIQVIMECGEVARAIQTNRRLLDSVRGAGSSSLVRGWMHINQATLMYRTNNLDVAEQQANITRDLEEQTGGMPDVAMRLYSLTIKLALIKNDESAAREAAEKFIALANHGGVKNSIDWSRAVYAELMFRLKDWSAFDDWAHTYAPPLQPLFFPYRIATLQYARFLIRQKAWEESRRLIEEQVRLAHEAGHIEYEMELHIIRALMEQTSGNSSAAIKALEQALVIGESGGYVRVFLDEGDEMKQLLMQIQKIQTNDFVADLITGFGKPMPVDMSKLIEPLTEREIEVLRLIAEGMSNPEIAEKLFLSVGTVKTHVKHIYGKLNVDDRVMAARFARELGLVS
jgi:LuxR family maltose regulon positive regulatory protein